MGEEAGQCQATAALPAPLPFSILSPCPSPPPLFSAAEACPPPPGFSSCCSSPVPPPYPFISPGTPLREEPARHDIDAISLVSCIPSPSSVSCSLTSQCPPAPPPPPSVQLPTPVPPLPPAPPMNGDARFLPPMARGKISPAALRYDLLKVVGGRANYLQVSYLVL